MGCKAVVGICDGRGVTVCVEVGKKVGVGPRVRVGISVDDMLVGGMLLLIACCTSPRSATWPRQAEVSKESRISISRGMGIGLLLIILGTNKKF